MQNVLSFSKSGRICKITSKLMMGIIKVDKPAFIMDINSSEIIMFCDITNTSAISEVRAVTGLSKGLGAVPGLILSRFEIEFNQT